jgi:flagellar motility protein MotE (MotC chaperone)
VPINSSAMVEQRCWATPVKTPTQSRLKAMDVRNRRLSAPATSQKDQAHLGPFCGLRQEWVTTTTAAWRTAPSAMGFRIDTLPRGWQVVEAAWSEDPVVGWIPIEPRGYLQLCDIARAPIGTPEAAEATYQESSLSLSPQVSEGVRTPNSTEKGFREETASATSTRAALLALREEHVRLREANVALREKELHKRREIDRLCRDREAGAKELEQLRTDIAKEHEDLKVAEKQRKALLVKLERCREAIATAVSCVDSVYTARAGSPESPEELEEVVQKATAAGAVVAEMLLSLSNDRAAEDRYTSAKENLHETATKKMERISSSQGRIAVPLQDLNLPR